MKLEIELVPKPLWGLSLYKLLPRETWRAIRRKTLRRQGERCGICGAMGRLEMHELWEYDDVKHVQHLRGFILLCDKCHAIKHLGRTYALHGKDKARMDALDEHHCRVNSCELGDLRRHYGAALQKWKDRSEHEWTQDLGEWTSLVRRSPHKRQ